VRDGSRGAAGPREADASRVTSAHLCGLLL